jgi:hypothetical protein
MGYWGPEGMRTVGRRFVVAGALFRFALALLLLAAPFATAQTDTPPVTDTVGKRPPVTDPTPVTSPPQTSPPATKPPVFAPPPAPAPPRQSVIPFVPSGGATLGRTTTTTKPKNSQPTQQQPAVVAPGAPATVPATAAPTTAAADPSQSPATDPLVQVAGEHVSRQDTAQQLLAGGSGSGSGGNSTLTTVLLVGAVAILPIVGAFALGAGDSRKWFRRAGRDA